MKRISGSLPIGAALLVGSTAVSVITGAPTAAAGMVDSASSAVNASLAARTQSWITPGQEQEFFGDVLGNYSAPVTANNLRVMEAWARAEGSRSAYNPWNTTQWAPGSTKDSNGSTSFASYETAVTALTKQLTSLYQEVVAGFAASAPEQTVAAIVSSPWASSHYGGASDYRQSLIWKVYVELPRTGWAMNIGASSGSPVASVPGVVPVRRIKLGRRFVRLSWGTPAANGAAVKRFQILLRLKHPATRQWTDWKVMAIGSKYRNSTWGNLEPGIPYRIKIRARNSVGFGPLSPRSNFRLG